MTAIRVEVLGPLRLFVDDRPVDVRGPKRRAVLALLAMAQGRALTVGHLLDALWPAELPDSARGALHSHVFRLRGQLGGAGTRLETLDGAYRLVADLDLTRARSLRAAARDADPATAYTLLREAHGLWRGPVLAEFGEVAPLVAAAAGIEQLRTEVTDALVGAGVDAGRAPEVLGLSADTLAAEPLREPAVLLRMRALAATGQAADALAAGRGYRHRLAEEAGLDPSPALGELERDVAAGAAAGPAAPARARPRAAPRPVTPLVGRDAQVAAVHRLLDTERLVTVLGPGGVGKTRLALEVVGRREPAGVLLLAPVTAADAIPHALAAALNLQVTRGDVLAACVAHLAAGPGLLLVDNCEHLLDGVRDAVAALLDGCPQLTARPYRGPFRDGPRGHDAVHLEAEVVVQTAGGVLLHDERQRAFLHRAWDACRFRGLTEVAFMVFPRGAWRSATGWRARRVAAARASGRLERMRGHVSSPPCAGAMCARSRLPRRRGRPVPSDAWLILSPVFSPYLSSRRRLSFAIDSGRQDRLWECSGLTELWNRRGATFAGSRDRENQGIGEFQSRQYSFIRVPCSLHAELQVYRWADAAPLAGV